MISRHFDEFVALIIVASFHKQWEGELINVFYLKKIDYLNCIKLSFMLIP